MSDARLLTDALAQATVSAAKRGGDRNQVHRMKARDCNIGNVSIQLLLWFVCLFVFQDVAAKSRKSMASEPRG